MIRKKLDISDKERKIIMFVYLVVLPIISMIMVASMIYPDLPILSDMIPERQSLNPILVLGGDECNPDAIVDKYPGPKEAAMAIRSGELDCNHLLIGGMIGEMIQFEYDGLGVETVEGSSP